MVDILALDQVFISVFRLSPANCTAIVTYSSITASLSMTKQHIIIPSVLSEGPLSDPALRWSWCKKV